MTTPSKSVQTAPINDRRVITYRGQQWELAAPSVTSDGFLLATGWLLDAEGGHAFEDGFPVVHSFFLGRAVNPNARSTA